MGDLVDKEDVIAFIDEEIAFHTEREEPFYIRWFCKIVRLNTPKEVVIGELNWIRLLYSLQLDRELQERNNYITLEELEKELGI